MTSVAAAEPHPLSRARRIGARSLTVLGIVLALVSLISVYVHYELVDDSTFRDTSRLLVQNPAIQQQISTTAVETLFANVDVADRIEARLPAAQKGLAVPI